MLVSWMFSTFFFQSLLRSWGPSGHQSKMYKIPFFSNFLCCGIIDAVEEKEMTMQKAYTVSETVLSQVSQPSLDFSIEGPLSKSEKCIKMRHASMGDIGDMTPLELQVR